MSATPFPRLSAGLVRFLIEGSAARRKKTRDLVRAYLSCLKRILPDLAPDAGSALPASPAEEEAFLRERRAALRELEPELLHPTLECTFHGWSVSDWKAFDAAYFKEMDPKSHR